ncbi:MAG TPA: hypothetical protein VHT21_22750 [Stellaceae bacterium]|nr:hypothetical protein [Stellaceae bacterium]
MKSASRKNTIRIATTGKGSADEAGARETVTIVARRPRAATSTYPDRIIRRLSELLL